MTADTPLAGEGGACGLSAASRLLSSAEGAPRSTLAAGRVRAAGGCVVGPPHPGQAPSSSGSGPGALSVAGAAALVGGRRASWGPVTGRPLHNARLGL